VAHERDVFSDFEQFHGLFPLVGFHRSASLGPPDGAD
jgi:hypothetical protein